MKASSFKTISHFLSLALLLAVSSVHGRTLEKTETHQFPIEGIHKLHLSNTTGTVQVVSTNTDLIEIIAELRVRSRSKQSSEALLDQVNLSILENDGVLSIKTIKPKTQGSSFWGWITRRGTQVNVNYSLRVPAEIELELHSVNGRITVDGLKGFAKASTVNGKVKVTEARGPVDLSTVNGSVECHFASDATGSDAKLSAVNGRIRLALPEAIEINLQASTTNGSIRNSFPLADDAVVKRNSIRTTNQVDAPNVVLSTVNGSIAISGAES